MSLLTIYALSKTPHLLDKKPMTPNTLIARSQHSDKINSWSYRCYTIIMVVVDITPSALFKNLVKMAI